MIYVFAAYIALGFIAAPLVFFAAPFCSPMILSLWALPLIAIGAAILRG